MSTVQCTICSSRIIGVSKKCATCRFFRFMDRHTQPHSMSSKMHQLITLTFFPVRLHERCTCQSLQCAQFAAQNHSSSENCTVDSDTDHLIICRLWSPYAFIITLLNILYCHYELLNPTDNLYSVRSDLNVNPNVLCSTVFPFAQSLVLIHSIIQNP